MFKISSLVIILGFYILTQTEGCGRTPTKQEEPPTTATPSNTTIPENHRLACTENETEEKACLNGGTCLVSILDDYRVLSCQCPNDYTGDRCHMRDPNVIFGIARYNPTIFNINQSLGILITKISKQLCDIGREATDKVTRAGLAAGLTALILFLTVLIFIIIWHRRYKRKKEREKDEKQKQLEESLIRNGDLNNGNYKPSLSMSRNRDSYSERIPLAQLPINQTEEEIQAEEVRPVEQNFSFSDSDVKRLSFLSYIKYVDDDDDDESASTNV